ncbi:MAG: peptidoglycan DD-metalloendopeptidase family protein [Endomicrobiales bacterium]|nr:peptidoglycan DD-metalloendopeptidase family protein [Endomicrobiales bacterium]
MSIIHKVKKELKRHLTFMLIPHNTIKPVRITFSLSFILFLIVLWTGLTLWAGYLASRHMDYWRIKAEHNLMKLKVMFFAQQVKKSRQMLEEVRENDENIRSLLKLKSKKAIIEEEGRGGPSLHEAQDLTRLLEGKIYEMNHRDIYRQTSALLEETKKQLTSQQEITQYVEDQRAIYRAIPNCKPCVGRITSKFGYRVHPVYKVYEMHTGVDIANAKNTPVYATAYGTVIYCDWQPGYGRLIIIDHGYSYKTYYGHLSKYMIKPGDYVKRGQLIALMGNTGTSTGDHLHYEVRLKRKPTNPQKYFKKSLFEKQFNKSLLANTR